MSVGVGPVELAAATLRAFLHGEVVDLRQLRVAIDMLGKQSLAAARIATRAISEGAAMIGEIESHIDVAEQWSADAWLMGYRAGEASMAARASHMLGHAVNSWKLAELEASG